MVMVEPASYETQDTGLTGNSELGKERDEHRLAHDMVAAAVMLPAAVALSGAVGAALTEELAEVISVGDDVTCADMAELIEELRRSEESVVEPVDTAKIAETMWSTVPSGGEVERVEVESILMEEETVTFSIKGAVVVEPDVRCSVAEESCTGWLHEEEEE